MSRPPLSDHLCECGCGRRTRIAGKTDSERGTIRGEPRRYIHGHNPRVLVGSAKRASFGATVSVRRVDEPGEGVLFRTEMTTLDALRAIIADLDETPGDWRIVCISTPVTIYRDMHGDRPVREPGAPLPEVGYLSKLRRLDLLPPPSFPEPVFNGPHHSWVKR